MAERSFPVQRQRHLKERAADEFKQFLVIFLYLWVSLACCPSTRASFCHNVI